MSNHRTMLAVAAALAGLLAAASLASCDERPRRDEQAGRAQQPPAPQKAESRPPQDAKPGARPETDAGAAANLVGTWRVRLESGAGGPEGVVYTFTADGRVTVGPGQDCRYRVAAQVLSIDCTGTSAASASGRLERPDRNTLVWTVDDKVVRLERQNGVKEQQ
jgi:hypothetical protein